MSRLRQFAFPDALPVGLSVYDEVRGATVCSRGYSPPRLHRDDDEARERDGSGSCSSSTHLGTGTRKKRRAIAMREMPSSHVALVAAVAGFGENSCRAASAAPGEIAAECVPGFCGDARAYRMTAVGGGGVQLIVSKMLGFVLIISYAAHPRQRRRIARRPGSYQHEADAPDEVSAECLRRMLASGQERLQRVEREPRAVRQ